jgi:hypothetical protein
MLAPLTLWSPRVGEIEHVGGHYETARDHSGARIGGKIVIGHATASVLVSASGSIMDDAFQLDLIPALSRDPEPGAVMARGRSTPY